MFSFFTKDIAIKLPISFDIKKLKEDLIVAKTFQFSTHPLKYHDGKWSVVNLYYAGGELAYKHEGDLGFGEKPPQKTEVLAKCPYLDEVLESLPGEIIMARLSAIPAGGRVHRHYDPVESADFGHFRIHLPIVTNKKVVFRLGFKRQIWREGELWYGDFTYPHSIHNRSNEERVHLIVDLKQSDELMALFPEGFFSENRTESRAKARQKGKDWSWYLTKLERLIGRDAESLQKKRTT
jgi:hypothetical protein